MSKIESFSEKSRFLTFFSIFRGFKINYFDFYFASFRFFVICTLPTKGSIKIKNKLLDLKNGIFFKMPARPSKSSFSPKNKRPIKLELYQNSFWVYVVWLIFPVVFENISCPNFDFIPMSKFSFLKMGPNTKQENLGNFVKFRKIYNVSKNGRRKGMELKFPVLIPFMNTN